MAKSNVEMVFSGDEAKLLQSLQRAEQRIGNLEKKLADAGRTGNRAGQQMQESLGPKMAGHLGSTIAGIGKIAAGLGGVSLLLGQIGKFAEESAQQQRAYRLPVAELGQLARTPDQMRRLVQLTEQTARETGMPMEQSAALTFQLESAGAMQFRELFAQLRAQGLVSEPGVMAKSAAALQTAMGVRETGDMRALVSKAFAASAVTPHRAEEILAAAARAGGTAGALGLSDEEVLAATAVVSKQMQSPEEAGTYMRTLLGALEKKGFAGKPLAEAIQDIRAMEAGGQDLRDILGEERAITAFRSLAGNLELYTKTVDDAAEAQREDLIATQLSLPDIIPELKFAKEADKAKIERELATKRVGALQNVAESVLQSRSQLFLEKGGMIDYLTAAVGEAITRMGMKAFGPEFALTGDLTPEQRRMAEEARAIGTTVTDAAAAQNIVQATAELKAAARELKDSVLPRRSPTLGGPDHDPRGN